MKKNLVLIHYYFESGKETIIAFSDSRFELTNIMLSHPRFGSHRHSFYIVGNNDKPNVACCCVKNVKDENLLSICKNIADYLTIAEYALLKNSYLKSKRWYDIAKDSAVLACDILNNY